MELPDLGKHCNESSCRQLDFLPVKCDACKKIYCSDHYKYEAHNCPLAYQKNVQVPVCPLCNSPVPGRSDELPDIRVSRHIDEECQSDRAVSQRTKQKVYSNKCSSKGCKQKEMIPLVCDNCGQNFCLRHRLPPDHACTAPAGSKPLNKAARAALGRSTSSTTAQLPKGRSLANGIAARPTGSYNQVNIQGNLSENDALQIALQASMTDAGGRPPTAASNSTPALSQEQADFLLARALQESEQDARRTANPQSRSRNQSQRNCQVT